MTQKRFIRTIEDFICLRCGRSVVGTGYTNHCPACLSSRHVDVNPGDRAALCGGLMPAIGVESENGRWMLTHRCDRCGFLRRQGVAPEDDFDAVVALSRRAGEASGPR